MWDVSRVCRVSAGVNADIRHEKNLCHRFRIGHQELQRKSSRSHHYPQLSLRHTVNPETMPALAERCTYTRKKREKGHVIDVARCGNNASFCSHCSSCAHNTDAVFFLRMLRSSKWQEGEQFPSWKVRAKSTDSAAWMKVKPRIWGKNKGGKKK